MVAARIEQWLAVVALAAMVAGCSTAAAIERRSGPTIVGHIDYADAHRLYVTGDDFGRYSIERADIVDIDHPGKIGRVVGGITTGIGVGFLGLALAAPDCPPQDPDSPGVCWDLRAIAIMAGVGYLLVGLPILLRNVSVLSRSQAAAEPAAQPFQYPLRPAPSRLSPP